jgi:hypothetical protein
VRHGLMATISQELKRIKVSREEFRIRIFERVFRDKVWIEKESPLPLDRASIDTLIDRSLKRFEGWGEAREEIDDHAEAALPGSHKGVQSSMPTVPLMEDDRS